MGIKHNCFEFLSWYSMVFISFMECLEFDRIQYETFSIPNLAFSDVHSITFLVSELDRIQEAEFLSGIRNSMVLKIIPIPFFTQRNSENY